MDLPYHAALFFGGGEGGGREEVRAPFCCCLEQHCQMHRGIEVPFHMHYVLGQRKSFAIPRTWIRDIEVTLYLVDDLAISKRCTQSMLRCQTNVM